MNGAGWIASPRWQLAQKMRTDFPDAMLAEGGAAPQPPKSRRSAQAVIGAGASAGDATGSALDTAGKHYDHGVDVGAQKTGRSLKRALCATGRFLGLSAKEPKDADKKNKDEVSPQP
jgi:hypothetical protein